MSKSLKKTLLIVGIAAAVCAAVWGGLTLARNAQRGDVKVFDVPSFAMTDYWGDTANTSGTVSTDKLQKIYLSQSQTVSQVYVKEGQNVKKGDKLLAYDTTLSQAEVEGAQIQLERMQLELETAKNNLSLYRKAENREELQKEYDRVAAILEKLRSQQDQLAGRGSPVKQGRLGDSLGQSKDKPLYYQWLEDTRTKEYYLTDDIIRNDILPKSRNSAYVVLVTRAGNVNNGAITCYGMYIVAEDTETPVKLKVMNDLPAYQDGYVTPTTAEIKDREEQLATIKFTVDTVAHRVPVIAGAGSNDTDHGCALAAKSAACGADALLMVTPYYNKTSQAGLVAHFTAMAEAGGIPVIVYNVPSRTGLNIAPETALELSKHPLINGIKEASGNISQVAKIAALCGDELNIYSGNDDQVVPLLALGGKGVISVVSNVAPELVHNCCQAFFDGDTAKARDLQLEMLPLSDALFCEVNPIPIKYAMNLLGWEAGECRLPLVEPSEAHQAQIENTLRAAGLIQE